MKNNILIIFFLFFSCRENVLIQKPFIPKKNNFLQESAERSRNIHKKEDDYIKNYIKFNKLNYKISNYGFWYKLNENGSRKISKENYISIYYIVKNLKNEVIYTKNEKFLVDKSDVIKGLNECVKLLGKNESGSFIIPSYMAYGFLGDNNKIKKEIPLIYEIKILDVEKIKH